MYLTESEFEAFIKRDLTAKESTMFAILEPAIESFINNHIDTNFNNVNESSKYYDGGEQEINIDTCNSITKVEYVDEEFGISSEVDSDEYIGEPYNETIKWSLRNRYGKWQRGIKNIKVTAKFTSYLTEVPADIKLAVAILSQGMINNPAGYKSESLEGYSYQLEDISKQDERVGLILAKYRRIFL